MKKIFSVTIMIFLIIGCSDDKRKLNELPKGYNLEKTIIISGLQDFKLEFYEIEYPSFGFEEVKKPEIRCKSNCSECEALSWVSYSLLNKEKKDSIYTFVEKLLVNPDTKEVMKLMNLFEQNELYVAGCYQENSTLRGLYKDLYFFEPLKRDFVAIKYAGD